jgi:hypothetical protein
VPAKKTTAKRATAKKPTAKKAPAKPRDLIIIDSPQVGSPPREGEVLEFIQGEASVSYRVQWADGHQTLIGPASGSARIVPASERT